MNSMVDTVVQTLWIASVPNGHVHVRHLSASDGVVRLPPAYTHGPVRPADLADRRQERAELAAAQGAVDESVLR